MLGRILHLVRFDLQSVAPIIAVWFGVLALESFVLWIGPPLPDPTTREVISLDTAVIVMRFAVSVVLAATLVHRHLLVGTTAFWRTRPMSRFSILASKVGSTALLTVAVPFGWFTATFLLLGLGTGSAARAAGLMAVEQSVVTALAFALAAVSSNLAQTVVGGLATILLYTTGRMFVVTGRPRMPVAFAIPVQAGDTVEVAVFLAAAIVLVLVTAHQYLTLRTWRSVLGLVLILCGELLLFRYPLWTIVGTPLAVSPGVSISAPGLVFDRPSMRSEHFVRLDERGRTTGVRYYAQIKDAGTPGPVVLAPRQVTSTLTFPDGTSERHVSPSWASPAQPGTYPDATLEDQPYASLAAAIGGPLLVDPRDVAGQRYGLTVLEVPEDTFTTRGRQPATLEVVMNTVAYRYAVSARLPLTPGARASTSEGACTFSGRVPFADGIALDIRYTVFPEWTALAPARFLLRHRAGGQALVLASARETSFRTTVILYGGLRLIRSTLQARLADRPSLGIVDEAWLNRSELVLMKPEALGMVDRTIRLDGFTLDRARGLSGDPAGVLTPPGAIR